MGGNKAMIFGRVAFSFLGSLLLASVPACAAEGPAGLCPRLYHGSDVLEVSGIVIRASGSFIIQLDHPLRVSAKGENSFDGIAKSLAVTGIKDWKAVDRKMGKRVVVNGYLFAGRTMPGQDADIAIGVEKDPKLGNVVDCNGGPIPKDYFQKAGK
jgi:hypothetical protein